MQIPFPMRSICLLFVFAFVSISSFAQESRHFLLADNVNVRSAPELNSSVVTKLPLGTELEILSLDYDHLTIKGYDAPWAWISFDLDGEPGKGYLWSGFITDNKTELPNSDNVFLLYGISSVKKLEYYDELIYQARLVKGGEELSRLEFMGIGSEGTYRSVDIKDDCGVNSIENVINFHFSDDVCGGAFGTVVVFWDGKDLHHIMRQLEGADAPYWSEEYFIYPSDSNGIPNRLILVNEEGGEDEEGQEEVSRTEKTYSWDGKKLVLKK